MSTAKVVPITENTSTVVFCYGSNSTKQLRARVQNPELSVTPAILRGYVRVFCLVTGSWAGGVASLAPSNDPNALTHGSIVSLSDQELERLDFYEPGYRKVNFTVSVGREADVQDVPAIAYIAGGEIEETGTFTLPLEAQPSQQYLWAIYGHLREHWTVNSIFIRSYDPEKGPLVVREWMLPETTKQLPLEALCVEISLKQTTILWVMPKTINLFLGKLREVNITSTMELVAALEKSPEELNDSLVCKGLEPFLPETISVMESLLLC
jgi:hypothetical protein